MGLSLESRLHSHCKESLEQFTKPAKNCYVMVEGYWDKGISIQSLEALTTGETNKASRRWPFLVRSTTTLTKEEAKAHKIWVQKRTK